MEQAGFVAIALFMAGVIYHAGRLSVRVEALEAWRGEVRQQVDGIFTVLRRIERHIDREDQT